MNKNILPLCSVFGECGGCQYQDISYFDEIQLKEQQLKEILEKHLHIKNEVFSSIVPSPRFYHYRSRLDLKLLKTKQQEIFMGFSPQGSSFVLSIEACPIAMESISNYLPELKHQASVKLPQKYRNANLVIKTGDDGRVLWGGIGRRSLNLHEEDYLWTEVCGIKIFYSLDTFFQANLSILPKIIEYLKSLAVLNSKTHFFDLYGGVGLFGVCLHNQVKKVTLIEENIHAIKIALFNKNFHGLDNLEIISSRVEDEILSFTNLDNKHTRVVMVDPPRKGLEPSVVENLKKTENFQNLLYLSCHPESLIKDLKQLLQGNWCLQKVIPFDFFPRTKHLEVLVILGRRAYEHF